MNLKKKSVLILVFFTALFLWPGIGTRSPLNSDAFPGSSAVVGIQIASAASQYGILGEVAPELNVNHWIDGNGKAMAPVRLSDYRGKVVYLYFFQDW